MVFKAKHFTTIALILGVVLGLSLWLSPSYAQMRHGRGGMAGGPNVFFLMRAAQLHAGSEDTSANVATKQPAKHQTNN